MSTARLSASSRASLSAFNAALTSRSSLTVISSTVFVAPVDGTVCGTSRSSDGISAISYRTRRLIFPTWGSSSGDNRSITRINRSACDVDISISRSHAVQPPRDSASFCSLTCFSPRPISKIASPATRLYAFISAVIVGRSVASCISFVLRSYCVDCAILTSLRCYATVLFWRKTCSELCDKIDYATQVT